jgi:hypothetical protein
MTNPTTPRQNPARAGTPARKIRLISALAALFLTAACVPAALIAQTTGSFVADSGLPANAVKSLISFRDGEAPPVTTFYLTLYPQNATDAQIAAAPKQTCRSVRKTLIHSEFMAHEPNHGGLPTKKLLIRCK